MLVGNEASYGIKKFKSKFNPIADNVVSYTIGYNNCYWFNFGYDTNSDHINTSQLKRNGRAYLIGLINSDGEINSNHSNQLVSVYNIIKRIKHIGVDTVLEDNELKELINTSHLL